MTRAPLNATPVIPAHAGIYARAEIPGQAGMTRPGIETTTTPRTDLHFSQR